LKSLIADKKENLKVILCGDSFKKISGLSYVTLNFAKYFSQKGYKVYYLILTGENCETVDLCDKGHFFYENLFDMTIINCQNKKDGSSVLFDNTIKEIKPNLVFSCHDLWQFENIANSAYRYTYKWISYCPIESHSYSEYIINPTQRNKVLRKSLSDICNCMDYAIGYNTVGNDQLKKLKAETLPPLPNGLDYYYFTAGDVSRQKSFKGLVKDDDFLFITVGHNFQRKGLDYVIDAFYKFLQYFPIEARSKYKLYIHGMLDTIDAGTDIKTMLYDLGIMNNVIMAQAGQQLPKRDLYKRYLCGNCYIGLPLAEGYGYGFMEAQINGLPIIYHNVGGISEYLSDNRQVNSVGDMRPNNYYCIWKIPDVDDAVDQMLLVVSNKHNIDINLNRNSCRNNYTWTKVFEQLDNQIDFNACEEDNLFNKLGIKRVY